MCTNLCCSAIVVLVIIIIVILYMNRSTSSSFEHPWASQGHQCFNWMSDRECVKYMNERKDLQDELIWDRRRKQDGKKYEIKPTSLGAITMNDRDGLKIEMV